MHELCDAILIQNKRQTVITVDYIKQEHRTTVLCSHVFVVLQPNAKYFHFLQLIGQKMWFIF